MRSIAFVQRLTRRILLVPLVVSGVAFSQSRPADSLHPLNGFERWLRGEGLSGTWAGVESTAGALRIEGSAELTARSVGPAVEFERAYSSAWALAGRHASGLPDGWTFNYNAYCTPKQPGSWDVVFHDWTGGESTFAAQIKGDRPTGRFEVGSAPYTVSGVSGENGLWQSLTLKGPMGSKTFIPSQTDPSYFHIHEIDRDGGFVRFRYALEDGRRLVQINDQDGHPILYFRYEAGWLVSVAKAAPGACSEAS